MRAQRVNPRMESDYVINWGAARRQDKANLSNANQDGRRIATTVRMRNM